jgi:putative tryptophan/tyrosine transport system substrate-binding protein
MLTAALLFASDAPAPLVQPAAVAFIGKFDAAADDPSFSQFRKAWLQRWPEGSAPPPLAYYAAGDGPSPRMHAVLSAAAASQPAVLVLPTNELALEARALGIETPIVFATYLDPQQQGIVELPRLPGRRTTGVVLEDKLDLKRLELLKEALPHVRSVAVLADSFWFTVRGGPDLRNDAQRLIGLRIVERVAETPEDLDALLSSAEACACDAWYVPPSYLAYKTEPRIVAALRRLRLPAMHADDEQVDQGALMAYSQDESFAYEAMATLAKRVAQGEDAGSIPMQRPFRHKLSVRIEPDAPWLRLEPSLVRRADRVVRP